MKYPKITEAPICNHSPYLLFFFFFLGAGGKVTNTEEERQLFIFLDKYTEEIPPLKFQVSNECNQGTEISFICFHISPK